MYPVRWLWLPCLILMLTGCTSCGGGQGATNPVVAPDFDQVRAFADLVAQCDFGPRIPGSEAHANCLEWLVAQLAGANRIIRQDFSSTTALGGATSYDFTNIIAVFGADKPGLPFLLCAHWDSRPKADADPSPSNHNKPVPGANDGASGVAVLLEMARAFVASPPPRPVIIALVDAEDSGLSGSGKPYMGFCLGSAYLATHWPGDLTRPAEGVLLDLVGCDDEPNARLQPPLYGANSVLDFPQEQNSVGANRALVQRVWQTAARRGHAAFENTSGHNITDDHLPFIENGIKMIDIIDFPPEEWHTVDDTPEHCSADALYQTGDTLLQVIYAGN